MPPIVVAPLSTLPLGSTLVLPNEIVGLKSTYHLIAPGGHLTLAAPSSPSCARILFVLSGSGRVSTGGCDAAVSSECAVIVPRLGDAAALTASEAEPLGALELTWELSDAECDAMRATGRTPFTQHYADAPTYREAIKSPRTVSRTLVPAGVVPRFAAGSVYTTGPDVVAKHAHPMLEQLFIGLPASRQRVEADEDAHELVGNEVLHIPLGSMHGATVADGDVLSYIWVDMFRDAAGMAWLDNHKDD